MPSKEKELTSKVNSLMASQFPKRGRPRPQQIKENNAVLHVKYMYQHHLNRIAKLKEKFNAKTQALVS